ncbi:MAG: hypothetical protein KA902_01830 [Arenimonas sp.]|nr:hypothetical protein [Arenimonas sp.]
MQSFEQLSDWIAQKYTLRVLEPYLLCLELSIAHGKRHQSVFISELIDEDAHKILRVSTLVADLDHVKDLQKALAFNWHSRSGYLALCNMDDKTYLSLCENRPYSSLSILEVERIILRIGGMGDQIEKQLQTGDAF